MFSIGNKSIFITMIVIVVAVIVDNSIVGIVTSIGGMRSSLYDIALFTIMVLVFALGQYIILKFVKSRYLDRTTNETTISKFRIQLVYRITAFVQYVLLAILASVIFQIVFISSYHIYSIILAVFFSLGLSVLLLSLLAKHFFSWYRLNRSSIVLFYGLAMTLISMQLLP